MSNQEWEKDLKIVKNRKLEFHEILWLEAILDINSQIKKKSALAVVKPSFSEIKKYLIEKKEIYKGKTQSLSDKYENKLLWYLEDEEPDIFKIKLARSFLKNNIFDVGLMTKEDFLIKTELYKKKPNNLSEKEIKDTFEQTLLYINSRPEGEKEDLIYKLAYSLGSGKNLVYVFTI